MRFSFLAVVAVLMLSGCNTMYQHGYEKVMVRTPGVDNAYCDLYTDTNQYEVMTSRQVIVERSNLPLTIICKKTGYYPASVIVDPAEHTPAMGVNVLNGFIPGAAYDVASNSIYAYPDTVTLILLPMPPQEQPPEPADYVTQKKPEPVKPLHKADSTAADKSMSDSGKK
jgi:hypothetical protein